jgi:hypothetical protein
MSPLRSISWGGSYFQVDDGWKSKFRQSCRIGVEAGEISAFRIYNPAQLTCYTQKQPCPKCRITRTVRWGGVLYKHICCCISIDRAHVERGALLRANHKPVITVDIASAINLTSAVHNAGVSKDTLLVFNADDVCASDLVRVSDLERQWNGVNPTHALYMPIISANTGGSELSSIDVVSALQLANLRKSRFQSGRTGCPQHLADVATQIDMALQSAVLFAHYTVVFAVGDADGDPESLSAIYRDALVKWGRYFDRIAFAVGSETVANKFRRLEQVVRVTGVCERTIIWPKHRFEKQIRLPCGRRYHLRPPLLERNVVTAKAAVARPRPRHWKNKWARGASGGSRGNPDPHNTCGMVN